MPASNSPEEIQIAIRRLQELPPLSANAQCLLAALDDDDIALADLAKLIEACPAVAARVVGLARSAFFAQRVPVRSVADALIRVLGLKLVKNLVVGIIMSGPFQPERCPGFSTYQYWGSALLTAILSRSLISHVAAGEKPTADSAYLCGLLHNLGLLALTHVAPEYMEQVFHTAKEIPERSLSDIELETLGTDHCEVGSWLAFRWHLPEEVQSVIKHQRQVDYQGSHWPVSRLVALSSRWSQDILAREEPTIDAESAGALGIELDAIDRATAVCRKQVEEIKELSELFA